MTPEQEREMSAAMHKLRAQMPPEAQERFDRKLAEALHQRLLRAEELQDMVTALKQLHRAGTGERSGFCSECGNVVPCQTVKFIQPFL